MRFTRFRNGGEDRLALVLAEEILDLTVAARVVRGDVPATMRAALQPGGRRALQRVADEAAEPATQATLRAAGAFVPLDGAELVAPIADPGLLLAIGMNYYDHVREMNASIPNEPYSFTKSVASIVGPNEPVHLPASNPAMVDLEAELTIVIGSEAYRLDDTQARDAIAGYTIANDVSARDWVRGTFGETTPMGAVAAWGLNLLGKQFPTFCPLGPWIVTADEVGDAENLAIVSRINGEVLQDSGTDQMIFSPARLVAYFSQFYRLQPGDLILTGTPAGVGFSRGRFFAPGDVVEVEIERIGRLSNPVIAS